MKNKHLSRREALKLLLATTGATSLASLPGQWQSPVVEVGQLPAHAQGSPTVVTTLQVILTWNDGVDLDLRVREPGGSEAVQGNNTATLSHSGNDFPNTGGSGREEVNNRTQLESGTYQVYVDWVNTRSRVEPDPQPSLTIITHTETVVISPVPISSGQQVLAANVDFDSGLISRLV